jgi:hypothetical protein
MWWQELRLDRRIWRLPPKTEFQPRRTKNGREHLVDLSPQAVAILEALPVERKGLVFTTTGLTPVSGFSKAKRRLDTYMRSIMESQFNRALVPWRVHDLRRTMSTLMGEDLRASKTMQEQASRGFTSSRTTANLGSLLLWTGAPILRSWSPRSPSLALICANRPKQSIFAGLSPR